MCMYIINYYVFTSIHDAISIKWSPLYICTRDKVNSSFVPCRVKPLYKGQVGDSSFVPCRVKPLYKGQVGDSSFVPCRVKPLYKGQVGDSSFVPCTVKPLYKGQVVDGELHVLSIGVLFSEVYWKWKQLEVVYAIWVYSVFI